MKESQIQESLRILREARQKSDAITVAYSGGKDSLCVIDLCTRAFDRVEAFYQYVVPGLECIDEMLHFAEKRWGIKVRQYPHASLCGALQTAMYCDPGQRDTVPDWSLHDIYKLAAAECGTPLVANGFKRADGLGRRRTMQRMKTWQLVMPIVGWNKFDVMGYMKLRDLPLPKSAKANSSGIGFEEVSLLWLHDTYPRDFQKFCNAFPYAEAVVWRRHFYAGGPTPSTSKVRGKGDSSLSAEERALQPPDPKRGFQA